MEKPMLEIAVGVLCCENEVCLSRRQSHQSHAGCWEFPGGKIEAGESIEQAMQREFQEELGIETREWQHLITIPWEYEKVCVNLNVYQTFEFSGKPHGKEGQEVKWFAREELRELEFPAANQGILKALELNDKYLITGKFLDIKEFSQKLQQSFQSGIKLAQLRLKDVPESDRPSYFQSATELARENGAKLLLNGTIAEFEEHNKNENNAPFAGVQLSSSALFKYDTRPISHDYWLGASTHNWQEIEQALKIGADFILLSPVQATATHPDMPALGWEVFAEITQKLPVPVFALGGMDKYSIATAKLYGGQGVAAISAFWGFNPS